ncbi:MAG: FAD-dependent oxidoreductase [Bacteroidetes bacterium]|nr:FAD-dependent oxidoreductase [Bacteroidota bacterium]
MCFQRVNVICFSIIACVAFSICSNICRSQNKLTTEVLVIGGGTGGTAAGIQSSRSGAQTIIIEQTNWLGGMLTAAGVSCTDGNDALPSGIWKSFRDALHTHYHTENLATGWVSETCFEPHVGDSIFKAWASSEKKLKVLFGWRFEKIIKKNNQVTGAIFSNAANKFLEIKSKITIDATELGDAFADAGAEYDIGTENSIDSKEKMAPGKTDIIQDITWAATLKDFGPGANKVILRPTNYDSSLYDCCCSSAPCKGAAYKTDAIGMLNYGKLPGNKYMLNWPAHGNDFYFSAMLVDDKTRRNEYEKAREHTLGFIYYIQTTLGFKNIGLADDELDSGLALIPYNREGRRLKGIVRFNINHILSPYTGSEKLYRTGIAVGDYPVDHHHGQQPGTPEIRFPSIPSFSIPLGALIPKKIEGLIVCEKGISVSNIVNGATRLQPVVLLTGQAAGVLAAWCVQNNKQPREADTRSIQQKLLDLKCYLVPFVDVKPDAFYWNSVQRIGVTGILRGDGKPEGWANKTFFYPDSTINHDQFFENFSAFDVYGSDNIDQVLSVGDACQFVKSYIDHSAINKKNKTRGGDSTEAKTWRIAGLNDFDDRRPIKRWELAVLLDKYTDVFNSKKINFEGGFIK